MSDSGLFSFGLPRFGAEKDDALTNINVEQAFLGALLSKPSLLTSIPQHFHPSHYGFLHHTEIHEALLAVSITNAPAAIPVMQMLALNDSDKKTYIASLIVAMVGLQPNLIVQYADLITDLHRRRNLVIISDKMRQAAHEPSASLTAESAIAMSMTSLDALSLSMPASPGVSLDEAIDLALHASDEAANRDGPAGLATGFSGIDAQIGGLEDGTLTVLAGRPGMGKSALGWQIAVSVARAGVGVVVISLEMSALELGRRALATLSGVEVWRMKRGKLLPGQRQRLAEAQAELAGLPMTIEDGGGLTAAGIGLKVRAAHRKHGVGLIMVDHLHIVRPEDADARHGATWAVGRISGAMKRMAKTHKCPVLLLAQLNRGVEGRDDKRPNLSDLRQSGDIEQDADAVAFVYRAEYYMTKEPERLPGETEERYANRKTQWLYTKRDAEGKAEIIFAKVRDGASGSVPLSFNGETTSFADFADERY